MTFATVPAGLISMSDQIPETARQSSPNVAVQIDLGTGGMTCASCVSRVERVLKKQPGVTQASVNLATASARITLSRSAPICCPMARAAPSSPVCQWTNCCRAI